MNDTQKQVLFENAAAMGGTPYFIKYRYIRNYRRCNPSCG